MKNPTMLERTSKREIVATHTFKAAARSVYEAWTTPASLMRWWSPASCGLCLLSCEVEASVGGQYRFEFSQEGSTPMAFFGRYLEVIPHARLVWTNEESEERSVTTVRFEATGGETRVELHECYPSQEALDAAFEGMAGAIPEQFAQLDELLLGAGARPAEARR